MKSTFYSFVFLFLCSINMINAQTLPNGGFDNWTGVDLFDYPESYNTSNLQAVIINGNPAVTQVTGVTGNAVHLESVFGDGEVIPGIVALFDFENEGEGGIPFTSSPDSVRMQLRYDIPMGDTATITFVFVKAGNPTGFLQIPITGTQNDFDQFSFNVPPILGVPDSLLFIAASSSFDDPVLGGFLELDDIVFTGSNDQLPNNDFEIWETVESTDPDGWNSFNILQSLFDLEPMVTQTNDAVSGTALRIETVEIIDLDEGETDTLGFLTSGNVFSDDPSFAVSVVPSNISGYYKFSTPITDKASIYLIFTKYNNLLGYSEEVQEFLFYLEPTTTYTPFNFEIDFTIGNVPDSVRIIIAPFDIDNVDEYVPLGSVLHLDNMSWDMVNGVKLPIFSEALELFPNPANEQIFINTESIVGIPQTIQLTDLAGREVLNTKVENLDFGNGMLQLEVKNLETGMYYYKLLTDDSAYSGKVMIQH